MSGSAPFVRSFRHRVAHLPIHCPRFRTAFHPFPCFDEAAPMPLNERERILFIGDSITDAGRDRGVDLPNRPDALGRGYTLFTAARLLADHRGDSLEIFNRGISGDRVTEMAGRWQQNCLDLQPTLLSVLIGVNDTWHRFGARGGVELDEYERVYRDLLTRAGAALEPLRLVLCEPFALRTGQVTDAWFPEFDQRREIVRTLADEFDATFVPFQDVFDRACEEAPASYWAQDGVHPTLAGHQRMSDVWLRAVRG